MGRLHANRHSSWQSVTSSAGTAAGRSRGGRSRQVCHSWPSPLASRNTTFLTAGLLERVVKGLGRLVDARVEADGAGVEVQQAHLLVERRGVGEHPAVGRLRVDLAQPR